MSYKTNRYVDKYFVDGYDRINNVVYEVDEYHHKFREEYDKMREQKIKNILNCNFIRINERKYLNIIGDVK